MSVLQNLLNIFKMEIDYGDSIYPNDIMDIDDFMFLLIQSFKFIMNCSQERYNKILNNNHFNKEIHTIRFKTILQMIRGFKKDFTKENMDYNGTMTYRILQKKSNVATVLSIIYAVCRMLDIEASMDLAFENREIYNDYTYKKVCNYYMNVKKFQDWIENRVRIEEL
jgi:hypothetical protein